MDDRGQPVAAEPGMVYSTSPRLAGGSDGHEYFIKGPALEVVVAEAVGYELARRIGLPVPEWALSRLGDDDQVYFASRAKRLRSGVDQLISSPLVANKDFLGCCIAFDTWTSNRDRNANNVVAEPVGGAKRADIQLVAIDFEKADILRGIDRFTVTQHPARAFRPTGHLAQHCRGLAFPQLTCAQIQDVTKDEIARLFAKVEGALSGQQIAWADSASDYLAARGRRIVQLVQEVWDA